MSDSNTRTRLAPGLRGTRLLLILKHLRKAHPDEKVRSIATGAMFDPTYVGLGALHDYLDENGHPEGERFNFRGAGDKLLQDKEIRDHVRGAIRRSFPGVSHGFERTLIHRALTALSEGDRPYLISTMLDLDGLHKSLLKKGIDQRELKKSLTRIAANAEAEDITRGIGTGGGQPSKQTQNKLETSDARRSLLPDSHLTPDQRKSREVFNYSRSTSSGLHLLRSAQAKTLRKIASQIHQSLQLQPSKVASALLDGPTSRADTVQAVYHDSDPDTVRYAAAWYGHLTQSPGLALFHVGDGPDSLYRFRYGGKLPDLQRTLQRSGIPQRVLRPHADGWDVFVLDPQRTLRKAVEKAAKHLGVTQIEESQGTSEALGSGGDRASGKGRKQYREIITAYEKQHGQPSQ